MSSGKALLGRLLGPLLFTPAAVVEARPLSDHFRALVLEGVALRKATWLPGDKLRVFVTEAGLRTYTPVAWDAVRGRAEILAYLHPRNGVPTPGADWARSVQVGDSCQLFGPQRSLQVDAGTARAVVFGDETSFGLARAFRAVSDARLVFEVTDPIEARAVLGDIGLGEAAIVPRTQGDTHLDAVTRALRDALDAEPGARLFLTGKAQSIQGVKARLKASGRVPPSRAKAYWAVGKTGLD